MSRIVFLEPPFGLFMASLDAPFSLMYLAGIAEQCGWEAQIVDMQTLNDKIPDADIYAVTSTSPQFPTTIKLSQRLDNEFPETPKIIGGPHISAEPDDLSKTNFNIGVLGEGENTLAKLLLHPEQIANSTCVKIHGIGIENLDEIPFPARHLIDWSKYKRGIYWGNEKLASAVGIISSRGCPHNCIFCGSHVVFGRRVRFRSIENVIAEIKQVKSTMGYRGFGFFDDTFCLNKNRVYSLCEEFAKLDIVWRCLSRIDTIDKKLLASMRDSGCKEIILGFESGNQQILNNLQKSVTVEQNLRAMKLVKESGIQLKIGIIVGSPGETWESIKDTMKLLRECPPDFWNVSVFTPYPGSAAWANPEKYKIKLLTRDLNQFIMVGKDFKGNVVVETEKMNKNDIEQARDEMIDLMLEIAPQNEVVQNV